MALQKLQYDNLKLFPPEQRDICIGYVKSDDEYSLYLQQQTGGTISASQLTGMEGDVVTLSNTPAIDYDFASYGISGASLTGNRFAFEKSNVTAECLFKPSVLTLTLQTDGHGTLTANSVTGREGDTVTLTPTYNDYYRFNSYAVTGGTINGNTFTFGNEDATAKASFKLNTWSASGNFNMITAASLGRNRVAMTAYPRVTWSSNATNYVTTANYTSNYKVLSAYSNSYTGNYTSTGIACYGNANASALNLTWNIKNKATIDYAVSRAKTIQHRIYRAGQGTIISSTYTSSNWTTGGGTTYTGYFSMAGNYAIPTGQNFSYYGYMSGAQKSDNLSLCNASTATWTLTGIGK